MKTIIVGNWPGHVETAEVRNGTCNQILSSKDLNDRGSIEGIFLYIFLMRLNICLSIQEDFYESSKIN